MITNFDELLEREMKNPEFAKEYNDLEPEFDAKRLIIEARINEGISQKELAERTGIKASNLSRIEHGKTSPTLKMLYKIAKGMGKKLKVEFV